VSSTGETRLSQTKRFNAGAGDDSDFWDTMTRKFYWKTLRKATGRG